MTQGVCCRKTNSELALLLVAVAKAHEIAVKNMLKLTSIFERKFSLAGVKKMPILKISLTKTHNKSF